MKSWKTTFAGALGALGGYLALATEPAWLHQLGAFMVACGVGLTGYFAQDHRDPPAGQ